MAPIVVKQTVHQHQSKAGTDEAAFRELYETHARLVRSLLFRLCGDEELDDLVQDTFVKIWKGLKGFQKNASLKTWIYRITYHQAMDALRKKRPRFTLFQDHMGGSEAPSDTQWILKGLQTLSTEHRSALVLHCMDGLSLEEVADITRVPVGTVKSRLHGARKKMHAYLQQQGVKYE